jgi:hypothetical protein
MNACSRVSTLGVAALHLGVTMSRAVSDQARERELVQGSKQAIEELLTSVNAGMREHVTQTIAFADNPVLGVEKIQTLMNEAFTILDEHQEHRVKAVAAQGTANAALREALDANMARLATMREAASGKLVVGAPTLNLATVPAGKA